MAKTKILIVEDERVVAADIQRSLQNFGYVVPAIVATGKDAIKKAEEYKPDLVLMDIVLEGEIDGLEAADQIRSRFNIPAIYLTAYSDEKKLERAKITEAFGYILKPFEDRELYITIEMALYKHRIEKKLKESKAYTEAIIQNFLDTLIVVDAEAKIKSVNPATCHLLGYTAEELVGQPVSIIFEEEEDPHHFFQFFRGHEKAEALRPQDVIRNRELTYKTRDGQLIPMSFNASVLTNEAGNVTGVVAGAKDITELKFAEEELQASRASFHNIVERSTDGIVVLDNTGVVHFVNSIAKSLFGRKAEELIGEHFGLPIVAGEMTEIDIIRKGGEIGTGEIRAVETEWEGKEASLAMIRDITERKRAEEEIKEKNIELLRLNTDLDEYVHFVSHDLRAPLRHIKALSLFINADYGDKLDETGKEYISKITTTCDDAETMIKELLELSKIRGIEIVREEVNLNEVIRAVETELEFFLKENNGRLEVMDVLPPVSFHRAWMKDLFLNLIMNGLKYNDSAEKVVQIGVGDKEGKRVFYVADNGVGIADNYREAIFNPFKRLNSSKSGTGLGLSICKKVVESHGGQIWVESEIGKGSTFFFSITD